MSEQEVFVFSLPNCFSICLDSDKKILPLSYKHVIATSSRKSKEKYHQLVCFRSLFRARSGTGKLNLLEILFEVCSF